MCKRRVSELLSKLSDEKRNEEERVSDLNSAFEWLHKELVSFRGPPLKGPLGGLIWRILLIQLTQLFYAYFWVADSGNL